MREYEPIKIAKPTAGYIFKVRKVARPSLRNVVDMLAAFILRRPIEIGVMLPVDPHTGPSHRGAITVRPLPYRSGEYIVTEGKRDGWKEVV